MEIWVWVERAEGAVRVVAAWAMKVAVRVLVVRVEKMEVAARV